MDGNYLFPKLAVGADGHYQGQKAAEERVPWRYGECRDFGSNCGCVVIKLGFDNRRGGGLQMADVQAHFFDHGHGVAGGISRRVRHGPVCCGKVW